MKLHRIYGIILRHFYIMRRSPFRITDAFYWPTIDLFIWGLTSKYFQTNTSTTTNIIFAILSGLLLWQLIWRGEEEITLSLLEEVWNKNLVNIFVSPLSLSEWIVSLVCLGISKALLSFSFGVLVAFLLFKINIFYYGFYLIPFGLSLTLSAWAAGFFLCGIIFRFTSRAHAVAVAAVITISPFSALYYPISSLPLWAQKIAMVLPTSYIFEGMREVLQKGYLDPNKLYISFALNIVYLILSLWFIKKSFAKILRDGLVKVY